VPVDDNGNPIVSSRQDFPSSTIVIFLLPFALAWCTANGRRSPGKRLLSLRVTTITDDTLLFGLAIKRELMKFLPLMFLVLFNLASFMAQPTLDQLIRQLRDPGLIGGANMLTALILLVPLLVVFAAIWWLFPMIVWRGQTFYDRFCDTKVVRG